MSGGFVGFDLDGTLAKYIGPHGNTEIGDPIINSPDGKPTPYEIAIKLHTMGLPTCCFSARAMWPGETPKIRKWLNKHGLPHMDITFQKNSNMICFFDDRSISVEENTGKILGGRIPLLIKELIDDLTKKESA
jgi:hypothetical protein